MKKHSGFTLIELMVVVVIMSILMAIAVPQYVQYVMRSQMVEASSTLSNLRVQLEQFYQDNRTYDNTAAGVLAVATPINTCGVNQPVANTIKYFAYTCALTNAGQGYTLTATGVATEKTNGFTFTLNEQNLRRTTVAPASWTSAAPANCWLMSQGATGC